MTICSLGNDNLLSRCVYSDVLNRKFPPKKPFRPENSDCAECVTFSLPCIKFNLSSGAFERRTATGSKTSCLFICLDATTFVLCIDKCHYSHRDDLPKNLSKNHCPRMQKVHFRWSLKRLILTRNVTRYSNEPIKFCCLLSNMVVLTFCIDKQMQEKKVFLAEVFVV